MLKCDRRKPSQSSQRCRGVSCLRRATCRLFPYDSEVCEPGNVTLGEAHLATSSSGSSGERVQGADLKGEHKQQSRRLVVGAIGGSLLAGVAGLAWWELGEGSLPKAQVSDKLLFVQADMLGLVDPPKVIERLRRITNGIDDDNNSNDFQV